MAAPSVAPIRTEEIPAAATVLARAFADAPQFRFLLPDDAKRPARLCWYWEATLRASVHSGEIVDVVPGPSQSEVCAVAIWEPPWRGKHRALTLARSGLWAAPIRLGPASWRRKRALSTALSTLAKPAPCWYLNAIGVEPSEQRRGLGTALLRRMLGRIDHDSMPSFLDTSARENLGYYERFGFRVTATAELPNGLPVWGMHRAVGAGTESPTVR